MFDLSLYSTGLKLSRRTSLALGGRGLVAGLLALFGLSQARSAEARCRRWILSGGPNRTDDISIDDDITVKLNGRVLLQEDDGSSSSVNPLRFNAQRGDRLQIIAFDAQADCHELSPLYLHCKTGGTPRKLSDGVPLACPNVAVGRFFKETFTV